MLVITATENDVIEIGDDVKIYITQRDGNKIRLCFDAPTKKIQRYNRNDKRNEAETVRLPSGIMKRRLIKK